MEITVGWAKCWSKKGTRGLYWSIGEVSRQRSRRCCSSHLPSDYGCPCALRAPPGLHFGQRVGAFAHAFVPAHDQSIGPLGEPPVGVSGLATTLKE